MNWELIHRMRRARRERFPQLLEQTQRMGHCLAVADRLQQLSTAVTAVAGQTGDWPAVATALCAVIADAGIALDAISDDAAFELDRQLQRMATMVPTPPMITTLAAAAAMSPALLQRPARVA